jgi:hypothetical protein
MDFHELQSRLREVDVEIEDGTLRRWAATKLIVGPKRDPRPGRQGARWNWPQKAVEEAAAVWALRHLKLDRFYSKPSLDTIKRVKFEAKAIHEKYKKDAEFHENFPAKIYEKSFDTEGNERYYLKSFGLHPFIITWIVTVEKVRHKKSVKEPANVIFTWIRHPVTGGAFEFRHEDVTVEPSDKDSVTGRYVRLRKE